MKVLLEWVMYEKEDNLLNYYIRRDTILNDSNILKFLNEKKCEFISLLVQIYNTEGFQTEIYIDLPNQLQYSEWIEFINGYRETLVLNNECWIEMKGEILVISNHPYCAKEESIKNPTTFTVPKDMIMKQLKEKIEFAFRNKLIS
jgi:hypothetical protein